jgi:hypothetical protein
MNLLESTFGYHSSPLVQSKSVIIPHFNNQILLIINQESGLDEELDDIKKLFRVRPLAKAYLWQGWRHMS